MKCLFWQTKAPALALTAIVLVCAGAASASERNQNQPSVNCANLLAPKSNTDSFVGLVRFLALEKNVLSLAALDYLVASGAPVNPIQRGLHSLSETDAHAARLAFDRLIAQGNLSWDVISAEVRSVRAARFEVVGHRDRAREATGAKFSLLPLERAPIRAGNLILTDYSVKFTTRSGEKFAFFMADKGHILNVRTGEITPLEGLWPGRAHQLQFYEKRNGELVVIAYDSLASIAIYNTKTGTPTARIEFEHFPELRPLVDSGPEVIYLLPSENAQGELELMVAHHRDTDFKQTRIRDFTPPVSINTKTKIARTVPLEQGDYRYFSDASGTVVAYGSRNGHFVAVDLVTGAELIATEEKTENQLGERAEFYRASNGQSFLLTQERDVSRSIRCIRVYSSGKSAETYEVASSWSKDQFFIEYEGRTLYVVLSENGKRFDVVDLTQSKQLGGAVPWGAAEIDAFLAAEMSSRMSRVIETVPGLGPVVIAQRVDRGLVYLGYFSLLTGEGWASPAGVKITGRAIGTYVTPAGLVHSLYNDGAAIRFVQIYGPAPDNGGHQP